MLQLFWLLLPVAAFSGWLLGRQERSRQSRMVAGGLSRGYLQGLNYLLNEQQDKAIEVFTRLVEVNNDTAEIHLALGSLFRRRGEVDRAIRIHQNLIARPSMTREQRAYVLLELGQDYMKAGLLDRAEALFEQVIGVDAYVEPALRQLLLIHQRGKDWALAIETARKLEGRGAAGMRPLIAQFYCEQAEQALQNCERSRAMQLLKRALSADSDCVRASLQLGRLEQVHGNYRAALKAFARVERQDPAFLPEVLGPMRECYGALRQPQVLLREFKRIAETNPSGAVHIALAGVMCELGDAQAAVEYLVATLRQTPSMSGIACLINLITERVSDEARQSLDTIKFTIADLLAESNGYECRQCGFPGRNLHWQCPSCRSWGTVKPILV